MFRGELNDRSGIEKWKDHQRLIEEVKKYKWHENTKYYKSSKWTGTTEEHDIYIDAMSNRNALMLQGLVYSAHELDITLGKYWRAHSVPTTMSQKFLRKIGKT